MQHRQEAPRGQGGQPLAVRLNDLSGRSCVQPRVDLFVGPRRSIFAVEAAAMLVVVHDDVVIGVVNHTAR